MQRIEDAYAAHRLHRALVGGYPIQTSELVPRGQVYAAYGATIVHPMDWMVFKFGRTPLWTRHMLGVREAERGRRKYP
jgi:hypothetical protein